MRINTKLQHNMVAVQTDTDLHLLLELTAPAGEVDPDRQPLRLSLAIDRSGSMAGGRLDAARTAAAFLVDQLHDDDQLALVTYDDTVSLEAPMTTLDRGHLHSVLAGIAPGGMTNLSGGWLKAAEEAGRGDDGKGPGVRRVVLLTDGHANQGITDRAQLATLAGSVAAQGVTTTTIGFGDGFDEDLLTTMADAGRGGAHFAASTEDLPGIFADEFADLVSLVAQNVSVELHPSDDVEVIDVLNTYPAITVPKGVQVQVGDAFAGQTIRIVLKLRIPALPAIGLANVGDIVLRWVSIGEQVTSHHVTEPLIVNAVSADEAAAAAANADVVDEVTVLLAGRRAAEARSLADAGDLDAATRLARQTATELRSISPAHPALAKLLAAATTLEGTAASMADRRYGARESKDLLYGSRDIGRRKRDQ